MKRKVPHPIIAANPSTSLPLFAAADCQRVRALPLPARRLARRLNLPPATAKVVAELAGFAMEAR